MELALSARLGQALDLVAGVHAEADGEVAVRGIESETRQRLRRRTLVEIIDRAAPTLQPNHPV